MAGNITITKEDVQLFLTEEGGSNRVQGVTIVDISGINQIVSVSSDASNAITISKTEPVVSVAATTNSLTVNKLISNIVEITAGGAQDTQADLVAPVATYNGNGNLTEINYNSGFRKVFAYDGNGYLSTVTFYQPNLPTTRKTLTYVNGIWQSTSAPVVVS